MLEILLYYASLLAVPVLSVGWPLLSWQHFVRGAPWRGRVAIGLSAALLGMPVFAARAVWMVLRLTGSSTAALGLLMVPAYVLIVGAWLFLFAWSVAVLVQAAMRRSGGKSEHWRTAAAAVLLAALAWWPVRTVRSEMLVTKTRGATAATLEALFERSAARRDPYVMATLAANPSCPPELLKALGADGRRAYRERAGGGLRALLLPLPGEGKSVLEHVAGHPHTPAETLRNLAGDPSPAVRAAVAANPDTPPEVLRRLADDPELPVQVALAAIRATPPDVLARLGEAESVYVRLRVAMNPGTPEETLTELASDSETLVRREVAANPKTPPAILSRLAGDEDPEVRFRLTTNPSLPGDLLQALAGDADEKVSGHAAQKLRRTRGVEDDD